MRRLIKYEFQKLLSPLMIITTALLLLLNSFLLYTDSTEAMKKRGSLDVAVLESIYDQYFNDPDAIISYYDELVALEKAGVILSNSPTQHVGYEVLSELPKEEHAYKKVFND